MIKTVSLLIILLLVLPMIAASCSDVNLQIKNINTEEGFIKISRLMGDNEVTPNDIIGEIRIYINQELVVTDTSGIGRLETRKFEVPFLLSKGQDINIDVLLKGDELCKNKAVLKITDENIYNYPECNYAQKTKGKWCIGNQVFTERCVKGQFEDSLFIDCTSLDRVCENGQCVESKTGGEDVIPEEIEEVTNHLDTEENDIHEENSSNGNSSGSFIEVIYNWVVSIIGNN